MMAVRASAPGKAVLSGEYAVLAGAPGIAVALDRRVVVKTDATANGWHELAAPGMSRHRYCFKSGADFELEWQEQEAASLFALFASVWRTLRPEPHKGLALTIDSSALFAADGSRKIGIGSSAAVAVALVGALRDIASAAGETFDLALAAHRDYQAGGSGIDVASSCFGGTILYRSGEPVEKLEWPADLQYRFFWSGVASDTVSRIGAFSRTGIESDAGGKFAALQDTAGIVADAWRSGNVARVLDVLAEYGAALAAFAADSGIDIFGAGHESMSALASQHGIVYKPCGAGGGDIGVAFSDDSEALAAFSSEAAGGGFQPLDVCRDDCGLMTQERDKE